MLRAGSGRGHANQRVKVVTGPRDPDDGGLDSREPADLGVRHPLNEGAERQSPRAERSERHTRDENPPQWRRQVGREFHAEFLLSPIA